MCLATPVFLAPAVFLVSLDTRVSLESQVIPVFQAFPVFQAIAHQVILAFLVILVIALRVTQAFLVILVTLVLHSWVHQDIRDFPAFPVFQATALQDIQASLVTQVSAVTQDFLVNLVILASQDSAVGLESLVILA